MNDAERGFDTEDAVAAAIDAAEDVQDLLDGLVEKTGINPGRPLSWMSWSD